MIDKRFVFMLMLLMVAVGVMSSVGAADLNATDEAAAEGTVDEVAVDEDNEEIASDENNVIVDSENTNEKISVEENGEDTAVGTTNEDAVTSSDVSEKLSEDSNDGPNYDSKIYISQSGKYTTTKVIKIKLTDLNNKPLAYKEVWYEIKLKGYDFYKSPYSDFGTLKTDKNGIIQYKWDLSGLSTGTYEIKVSGWSTNPKQTTLSDIKVYKKTLYLKPYALSKYYSSKKAFKVKVTDASGNPAYGVLVKAKIYTGKKYKTLTVYTDKKGIAYFDSKLSVGHHKVKVSTFSRYSAKSKTSYINVKKTRLTFSVKIVSVFATKGFEAYVKDNVLKKYKNGIKLKVRIYTGSRYITKYLVSGYDKDTKRNGEFGYGTNKLSVGTHKVVITPVGKSYYGKATTKIVVTNKAKTNYYGWLAFDTKGKSHLYTRGHHYVR